MTYAPATLTDLSAALAGFPETLPVVFQTEAGEIGAGYHLTELKHARINSIDCGGGRNSWDETQLQILDQADGTPLEVGKITSILDRSIGAIPELANNPLWLELSPGNRGLGRYSIGGMAHQNGRLEVALVADGAQCKARINLVSSCCGTGAASACC